MTFIEILTTALSVCTVSTIQQYTATLTALEIPGNSNLRLHVHHLRPASHRQYVECETKQWISKKNFKEVEKAICRPLRLLLWDRRFSSESSLSV